MSRGGGGGGGGGILILILNNVLINPLNPKIKI